jgi:hypothetical protein
VCIFIRAFNHITEASEGCNHVQSNGRLDCHDPLLSKGPFGLCERYFYAMHQVRPTGRLEPLSTT